MSYLLDLFGDFKLDPSSVSTSSCNKINKLFYTSRSIKNLFSNIHYCISGMLRNVSSQDLFIKTMNIKLKFH